MHVEVCEDPRAVALRVADLVADEVAGRPDAVLGLPTGATPLPVYDELVRRVARGALDCSGVRVFLLDEYVGLDADDPRSYRATIRRDATDPLGIPHERVHGPCGEADDPERAAADYEVAIAVAGGIDLQLAGIGRNGHVAFNEPGTDLALGTHVAVLSPQTRADNARFFPAGSVPLRAITQGPATLLAARRLVLVATGTAKSAALADAVGGPVGARCPASVVQSHPDAVVVADRAAAQLLDPRWCGEAPTPGGPKRLGRVRP